jgi:hypothetical protein
MAKKLITTRLYNSLNELLEVAVKATDNFPKSARYVVGAEIQRCAIRMLTDFADAYTSNNPSCVEKMDNLIANLETLKVLVTLAIGNRWLYGTRKGERIIRLLDSISRQSAALKNSFENRSSKELK